MPLPCYVSGVRQKVEGLGDCIVIHGADGCGYVFLPCGRDAHLHALADAKALASGINADVAIWEACQSMLDDHMTSETHHPGYVLVPTAAFEKVRRAVSHQNPSAMRAEGEPAHPDSCNRRQEQ